MAALPNLMRFMATPAFRTGAQVATLDLLAGMVETGAEAFAQDAVLKSCDLAKKYAPELAENAKSSVKAYAEHIATPEGKSDWAKAQQLYDQKMDLESI